MKTIQLEYVSNPLHDVFPKHVDQDLFTLLVTYMRSAETKSLNEYNQDALAIWSNHQRFVATIADGVGQSFRGDIAATAVVQLITRILWEYDFSNDNLRSTLASELIALSPKVQELLRAIDVSHHPVMFREALELRRNLGSESVFAACCIDWHHNLVYLCWLGDCRIRVIDKNNSPVLLDQQLFRTAERWSSQRMLVGDVHSVRMPLHAIRRIIMYSDGLYLLDNQAVDGPDLSRLVESTLSQSLDLPESDDVTFVAIDVTKHAQA
jgi:hypothetical protein